MVAEPTPIGGRREVNAVFLEDGWVACGATLAGRLCGYRFGFSIVGTSEDARVKCPNRGCGAWVRIGRPLRESVSRRL